MYIYAEVLGVEVHPLVHIVGIHRCMDHAILKSATTIIATIGPQWKK
jgi:hypothetical protein